MDSTIAWQHRQRDLKRQKDIRKIQEMESFLVQNKYFHLADELLDAKRAFNREYCDWKEKFIISHPLPLRQVLPILNEEPLPPPHAPTNTNPPLVNNPPFLNNPPLINNPLLINNPPLINNPIERNAITIIPIVEGEPSPKTIIEEKLLPFALDDVSDDDAEVESYPWSNMQVAASLQPVIPQAVPLHITVSLHPAAPLHPADPLHPAAPLNPAVPLHLVADPIIHPADPVHEADLTEVIQQGLVTHKTPVPAKEATAPISAISSHVVIPHQAGLHNLSEWSMQEITSAVCLHSKAYHEGNGKYMMAEIVLRDDGTIDCGTLTMKHKKSHQHKAHKHKYQFPSIKKKRKKPDVDDELPNIVAPISYKEKKKAKRS